MYQPPTRRQAEKPRWIASSFTTPLSGSFTDVFIHLYVSAQAITGTIVGTVHDPTGAVIVGAKVRVTNQNTGVSSDWTSDAQGNYVAPYLPPGNYRITAESSGFRTAVAADNVVQVNQTV